MPRFYYLLICAAFTGSAQESPNSSALLIQDVTVVHAASTPRLPHMDVLIAADRIAAVGPTGSLKFPPGTKMIAARGKFLIPGLWDMHTHTLHTERLDSWLPLFIANGVIGIRDMASPLSLETITKIKRECAHGDRIGPRIVANGLIFGGGRPELTAPSESPEEARAAVRDFRARGADFIKVSSFLSRAVFFAVAEEASRQGLMVVGHVPETVPIADAARAGMKSFEHSYGILQACSANPVQTAREIQDAMANKPVEAQLGALVRTTDRLYGEQARYKTYDGKRCVETARTLAAAGMWQCPTLTVRQGFAEVAENGPKSDPMLAYIDEGTLRRWRALGKMYAGNMTLNTREVADRRARLEQEGRTAVLLEQNGVGLLVGTDVGNPYVYPGFSVHEEMALLVKAGVSPLSALRAATLNPARFLGLEEQLGTVERGKFADVVLLAADPLEDIANSKKIWAVIAHGRYFDRNALDGLLSRSRRRSEPRP